jgi:hypothetical protein
MIDDSDICIHKMMRLSKRGVDAKIQEIMSACQLASGVRDEQRSGREPQPEARQIPYGPV